MIDFEPLAQQVAEVFATGHAELLHILFHGLKQLWRHRDGDRFVISRSIHMTSFYQGSRLLANI